MQQTERVSILNTTRWLFQTHFTFRAAWRVFTYLVSVIKKNARMNGWMNTMHALYLKQTVTRRFDFKINDF